MLMLVTSIGQAGGRAVVARGEGFVAGVDNHDLQGDVMLEGAVAWRSDDSRTRGSREGPPSERVAPQSRPRPGGLSLTAGRRAGRRGTGVGAAGLVGGM